MFSSDAFYIDGLLKLVLTAGKEEPWKGALIPTYKEFQTSLLLDFTDLVQHPILKKWLYLPESAENFENSAENIVKTIIKKDPRIGVLPQNKINRIRI
jgi:hypothetical protein